MVEEINNMPDKISIIVPCYNEEEVFDRLIARIRSFLDDNNIEGEAIFVDDGSQDQTWTKITDASKEDARISGLKLSRNWGHQAAVAAGLRAGNGDVFVVMDADLQDPPELITDMIDKWREGYEVVYGVRSSRRENILKKMCYAGFYRLLKAIADIEIALDAGDFSLMDRKVVDLLNDMPEHNRFIRGMRGWLGFRQIGISYARDERAAGSSKYEFMRLLKLAMDGIISFSTLPLRISSVLGFGMALVGFLYALYVVIYHVVSGNSPTGWSSMVFLILVFGGIQLIVLGIMGEYISRIYDESRKRPLYIVSTICGSINERRERSAQV